MNVVVYLVAGAVVLGVWGYLRRGSKPDGEAPRRRSALAVLSLLFSIFASVAWFLAVAGATMGRTATDPWGFVRGSEPAVVAAGAAALVGAVAAIRCLSSRPRLAGAGLGVAGFVIGAVALALAFATLRPA